MSARLVDQVGSADDGRFDGWVCVCQECHAKGVKAEEAAQIELKQRGA